MNLKMNDYSTIEMLEAQLTGRLIRPNDPDYNEERAVWNGMINKYPKLIAKCSNTG